MNYKNITHWNPVEESKDKTTFEGSLQSKMSRINFDQDFWDMLKFNTHRNTIRRFSAILYKEVNLIGNYMYRSCDF